MSEQQMRRVPELEELRNLTDLLGFSFANAAQDARRPPYSYERPPQLGIPPKQREMLLPPASELQSAPEKSMRVGRVAETLEGLNAQLLSRFMPDRSAQLDRILASSHDDLEGLTIGDAIWRDLEQPGSLDSVIKQLALDRMSYCTPIVDEVLNGERLQRFTQLTNDIQDLMTVLNRTRSFRSQWSGQMTGSPLQVLTSYPNMYALKVPIIVTGEDSYQLVATLILDAGLDRSALELARTRIGLMTPDQWAKLARMTYSERERHIPITCLCCQSRKHTLEDRIIAFEQDPDSQVGREFLKVQQTMQGLHLEQIERCLAIWQRASSE